MIKENAKVQEHQKAIIRPDDVQSATMEVKSEINQRFEKLEGQNSKIEDKMDSLSNSMKRIAESGNIETKSFAGEDYTQMLTNLSNPNVAHFEVNTQNSFINQNGAFETKSVMGTYNTQGLNIGRNVQSIIDEGKPRTSKVLPKCRTIANGNSLKDLEIPFVSDDLVQVGFGAAGLSPKETSRHILRGSTLKLHQISAKYPNIDDKFYTMMQNGDLPYDIFQAMMTSLEKQTDISVGRKVMTGSGNNEPLGLITDYNKNGTSVGYGEKSVSASNLNQVENLIELIYKLDDNILEEGGKLTIFVHKQLLFLLETAVKLAEDSPR